MSKPKPKHQAEQRTKARHVPFDVPITPRSAELLRRALEHAKSKQKGGGDV